MSYPKIIRVTWRDSANYTGWTDYGEDKTAQVIESVGFLIANTKDHIAIAGGYDGDSDAPWSQMTIIPKECIVGMVRTLRDG